MFKNTDIIHNTSAYLFEMQTFKKYNVNVSTLKNICSYCLLKKKQVSL